MIHRFLEVILSESEIIASKILLLHEIICATCFN